MKKIKYILIAAIICLFSITATPPTIAAENDDIGAITETTTLQQLNSNLEKQLKYWLTTPQMPKEIEYVTHYKGTEMLPEITASLQKKFTALKKENLLFMITYDDIKVTKPTPLGTYYKISISLHTIDNMDVDFYAKKIVPQLVDDTMNDFDKVRILNDYVVLMTKYSFDGFNPYSPASIITLGSGVCNAYTLFLNALLLEAGIESKVLIGYVNIGHAWNLVKVEDRWYHVDSTWNDGDNLGGERTTNVDYSYFLKSTDYILQSRTITTKYTEQVASDFPVQFDRYVINDYVFYTKWYSDEKRNYYEHLYKKSIKNVDEPEIQLNGLDDPTEGVKQYFITSEAIYYEDYYGRYWELLHTGEKKKIAQGEYDYEVKGGKLYSRDGYIKDVRGQMASIVPMPTYDKLPKLTDYALYSLQSNLLTKRYYTKALQNKNQAEYVKGLYDVLSKQLQQQVTYEEIQAFNTIMKAHKMNDAVIKREAYYITDPRKQWKITFSKAVKNTPENLEKVYILNAKGEKIAATVSVKEKQVFIQPNEPLLYDETYELVVEAGIANTQDVAMKAAQTVKFSLYELY